MLRTHFFELFASINHQLKLNPALSLHMSFDVFNQFACLPDCAQCCNQPWRIMVSQAFYEHWQPFFEQDPSGLYQDPFVVVDDSNPIQYANTRRKPGTHECIFLDENKLCFFHREFGSEAKPLSCQNYPKVTGSLGSSYHYSTLMGSCRVVPEMWMQEPELVYELLPAGPDAWNNAHYPVVHGDKKMTIYAFHLWLGLVFDTLLSIPSPIQAIRDLNYPLYLLERLSESLVTEEILGALFQAHSQRLALNLMPLRSERQQAVAVTWFIKLTQDSEIQAMGRYFSEIQAGRRPWLPLSQAEQGLLAHFLRNYLLHDTLGPGHLAYARVSLLQQQVMQAVLLVALQFVSYYFSRTEDSPLRLEHIRRAINLLDSRITQNRQWIKLNHIDQLSSIECLDVTQMLLSVNLSG